MNKPNTRLDGLKTNLRERILNRKPLTKQIQEEKERKNTRTRSNYWQQEIRRNWFIYFLLAISGLFTGMLGLFMGLAPHLTPSTTNPGQQDITFNTDFGHVIIAILLVVGFIAITEGAFAVGKWKFHTREENNGKQYGTMMAVMALALISILGTGWAGFTVVASTLGYFSEFREIPGWAQDWAVRVIPILFAIYTALFTVYWLSSERATMERIATQQREEQKQDHDFTMEMLELALEEEVLVAEAEALIDLVRKGKISTAQYQAARRAGQSVPDLEQELGRDLNDDNHIGPPPAKGPKHQPDKNKHSTNGKGPAQPRAYDLPGLLRALNMDQGAFKSFLMETDTLSKAWQVLRDDGRLPSDITHRNFNELAQKVNPTVGAGSR